MTTEDKPIERQQYTADKCLRKANQHWEMAGLARQDGDSKDAERHTKLAQLWNKALRELLA